METKFVLKLYVIGESASSLRAIKNIKKIMEEELNKSYTLRIIDVLKNPQLVEDDKILATPTLVKALPRPLRKIIGDLSIKEKVLLGLDLIPLDYNEDLK